MAGIPERVLRHAPPPRAVDWSILAGLAYAVGSGLYAFTVGRPDSFGWLWVWSHRAVGLTLVALVAFKLLRVRRRVTDPRRWRPSTALSVATALLATATLASGIAWGVVGLEWIAAWPLLAIHVGLGLVLGVAVLLHLSTRFRLPRRRDVAERRTALKYLALLAAGGLFVRVHDALVSAADLPGADRRFTGSKPTDGGGNDGFPVTMWVADDPDPVDPAEYALSIRGAVESSLSIPHDDLVGGADATEEALLDCTSGWYTVQEWGGVRVGDLLAAAGVEGRATHVRFVSVTGYRWSLPIAEARGALLATRVGGEPLSHGHGAPARLVAPGRRGFQWVKWVERIDVREGGDPAQWVVTLTSGFE